MGKEPEELQSSVIANSCSFWVKGKISPMLFAFIPMELN